jgi:hypothetical protein
VNIFGALVSNWEGCRIISALDLTTGNTRHTIIVPHLPFKFDQVIKEDVDMADAYKYRGIAKLGQGKEADATADFKIAAQMYNDSNLQRSYRFVQNLLQKSPS